MLAIAIEAHCSVSAKRGELIRRVAATQMRGQFLSDEFPRRDSVNPSQSVDVARQALSPDRSDSAWQKAVEAASGRNIESVQRALTALEFHCGTPGSHCNRG